MEAVFLYLDKNFQFTGFGKGMTQEKSGSQMATQLLPSSYPSGKETKFLDYAEPRFVSKEEVVTQCSISGSTFANWLSYSPAQDFEVKVVKGGKKLYRIDYVKMLFEKYGNLESFQKLLSVDNSSKPLVDQLLSSKDETISELKKQVELLTAQLETKDELLVTQLETIKEVTQVAKQGQFFLKQEQEERKILEQEKQSLKNDLEQEKKNFENRLEQEKQILVEKEAEQKNQPKKGWRNWFGGE